MQRQDLNDRVDVIERPNRCESRQIKQKSDYCPGWGVFKIQKRLRTDPPASERNKRAFLQRRIAASTSDAPIVTFFALAATEWR